MAECKELIPSMCGGKLASIVRILLCIEFEGLTDLYVPQGSDVDLYDGVKAVDQYGNEHDFTVAPSEIDTSEQGTYVVTYSVGDVTAERNVYVVGTRTVLYTDRTLIINELESDIDANVAEHGEPLAVYPPLDEEHDYRFASTADRYWNRTPLMVEVGSPIKPVSTAYWFAELNNCARIDLTLMDTSNADDMRYMFSYCRSLVALDVSHFDTSKVTNMAYMFNNCGVLTTLDVSNFDTSNVTTMQGMFQMCQRLTTIDASGFDTSKVTNMEAMFNSCSVADIDMSNFDTSNVTNMSDMFDNCKRMTVFDVSHFKTHNVTIMSNMFSSCSNATSILFSSDFDTSNVTDMTSMFALCEALQSIDVSNFDTSKVTDMNSMFYSCKGLTRLSLCSFDTSRVKNMTRMFYLDNALVTVLVSDTWTTNAVTSSTDMFLNCSGIVGGNGQTYDSAHKDKEYARIDAPGTPGYFTECQIY